MTKVWPRVTINDVCYVTDFVANGSFASLRENVRYQDNKGYAIVVRLTDSTKQWRGPYKYVSKDAYDFLKKSSLAPGDLVMANVGEPGIVFEVPELGMPMTLGPNAILIRSSSDRLLGRFMYYHFLSRSTLAQIKQISTGTAQRKFNKTDFRQLTVPLPPISEQSRIVGVLDKAFAAIANEKANIEKQITNSGAIFEQSLEYLLFDQGWEIKKLGELCEGVEYGSSAKSAETGKVPVLRMGNVQGGAIDWTNLVYTNDASEIDKYSLQYDDVLFNRTNSADLVGKTAVFKSEMPAIFAGYLIRIKRKETFLNADYLNYYLNSSYARNYGKKVMSSSVHQANINGTKLKDYPIPAPPLGEQQRLVSKFDKLKQETQALSGLCRQKISALDELKQSILGKAFSGEL